MSKKEKDEENDEEKKRSTFDVPKVVQEHKNYAGSPYKIKCTVTGEVKGVRKEILLNRIEKQEGKNQEEKWCNLLNTYISNAGKQQLKEEAAKTKK